MLHIFLAPVCIIYFIFNKYFSHINKCKTKLVHREGLFFLLTAVVCVCSSVTASLSAFRSRGQWSNVMCLPQQEMLHLETSATHTDTHTAGCLDDVRLQYKMDTLEGEKREERWETECGRKRETVIVRLAAVLDVLLRE